MKVKVLMIDDHPAILYGYEVLLGNSKKYEFEIWKAYNSGEALNILKNSNNTFQIVFLDIRLPISEKLSLTNGEELGLKIKKSYESKIIVLSSTNETERILSILQNLDPDGYIVKSDITEYTLLDSIKNVLNGKHYYSENIEQIRMIKDCDKNHFLDLYDIKIIFLISIGEKMKNMPNHVPLSLPTIERRKRKIKDYFDLGDKGDKELLTMARKKGFI